MNDIRAGLRRLYNSSVVWSWALNGCRLASGLVLLPLLTHLLLKADLGMYYVFLSLAAFVPIVDFGFSVSISRHISYAMSGATELKAEGLPANEKAALPNFGLLWRLLSTTRQLFRYLSLLAFVVLGAAGTVTVGLSVAETSSPSITWLAWGLTLLSGVLEIYAGWWNVYLRGMNEVLLSARISVLAYALKLVLACLLLLLGAGLLAVPAAGLVSSLLQRQLSRRSCLRRLGPAPATAFQREHSLMRILWPTSWRVGLQLFSSYLATHANALICSKAFGLDATAEYGLSLQIAGIIQGMAAVWTTVKWPLVGQYSARQDHSGLRRLLWPRHWLQTITFLVLAAAAFALGPILLRWQGAGNEILPAGWFALLLLNSFLELQFTFWTTLLSMENRVPSLWPTVITNITSLLVVLVLLSATSLGLGGLVLAPLLTGSLFGYWYWAKEGARSLQTRWWRFTFSGPH